MAFVERQEVTAEDFEQLLELPENAGRRLELIDGVIYELSPSQQLATIVAGRITILMGSFVMQNNLGFVSVADGGYRLSKKDFFAPDTAFISKERQPQITKGYFPVMPDLAVEVVSPNDKEPDVHRKAMRYLELGTRIVWVVYPEDRLIHVYTPASDGAHVQVVNVDGALEGGEVLAGFTLPARQIFPD